MKNLHRRIRNRIKEFQMVPARSLIVNPKNIRKHGKEQREAMKDVLERVGIVAPYVVRQKPEGLMLLDGELRSDITQDMDVPVVVLADDVTDEEAAVIVATFNGVGELGDVDRESLRKLIDEISNKDDISDLMERIHGDYEATEVKLKILEPPAPPKMSWVLIGIATVRFGEISALVESVAAIPGALVETTVTGGDKS